MILRKYWYILLILVVAGGGVWWKWRPRVVEYKEFTVVREMLMESLSAAGTVAAERTADLSFQTGGRLVWVGVKQGGRVRKWQAVAALDRRTVQKNLEKELNDYLKTRWDFQGNRETYSVSTDNLDQYTLTPAVRRLLEKSQFDLNNSVLDVEIAAVAKEFSTLISPFDGLVTDLKFPYPGINLAGGAVVATVLDPNSVYFEAEVDEVDISKVKVGSEVELVLDAYPDETIKTAVNEIDFAPVTLSGGGTGYRIKMALPEQTEDWKFKQGMNGNAEIIINRVDGALTLPAAAVREREGKRWVKVMEGKKLTEKEVQVGMETEDKVEIKSGLAEGDRVVD